MKKGTKDWFLLCLFYSLISFLILVLFASIKTYKINEIFLLQI